MPGSPGCPVGYFIQAMAQFKDGTRRSADPRKLNSKEVTAMANTLTDDEVRAAAEYYVSIAWTPRGTVMETETVPAFEIKGGMYLPVEGGVTEPLGNRIIEMPDDPEEAEYLRDPKTQWIAYAPVGSIAKGEALVTTGTATAGDGTAIPGRTLQCGICHGEDLNGVGNTPGIAGRSPSYLVR